VVQVDFCVTACSGHLATLESETLGVPDSFAAMADLKQVPSNPEARKWYDDARKQAGQIDQLLQYHEANEEHVMQLSKKLEQSLQMLKACQEACQEQWKVIDSNQRTINNLQKESGHVSGASNGKVSPAAGARVAAKASPKPSPKAQSAPQRPASPQRPVIDYDDEDMPDEIKDKLKALEKELKEAEDEKRQAEQQLAQGRNAQDSLTSQLMSLMQGLTEEEKRELCREDGPDDDEEDDDLEEGWEEDLTPEQLTELIKLRECLAMAEQEKAKQESVLKGLKDSLLLEEQAPSKSPVAKSTPKGSGGQDVTKLETQLHAVEEEQRRTKQELEAGRSEEAMLMQKLAQMQSMLAMLEQQGAAAGFAPP